MQPAIQRRQDRALVFLTGCFDVFHHGHRILLERAAKYGRVHVAIDSDALIRSAKGPDRPVDSWTKRCVNVKATNLVEAVYYLRDLEHLKWLIDRLKPDLMVKGNEDFSNDPDKFIELIGGLDKVGGILLFPRTPDISTSQLIEEGFTDGQGKR